MDNKSKMRVRLAGIVVVVLCVIGAGVYFALPYIQNIIDPSRVAIQAMKNARAESSSHINVQIEKLFDSASTGAMSETSGYVRFDSAVYNSQDLSQFIKVNTLKYNCVYDAKNTEASGSISLETATESNIVELDYYTDGKTLYFSVPKLLSYRFKLNISDTNGYINELGDAVSDGGLDLDVDDITYIFNMLGSVSSEESTTYARMCSSLVNDISVGLDRAIEEFTYEKVGKADYKSDTLEYDGKVTNYKVTVTKDALIDGAYAAIDAIYDDDMISSYRTLISSYYKNSKEKLKNAVRSQLEDFEDFDMTIYVTADKRVLAYKLRNSYGTTVVESAESGLLSSLSSYLENGDMWMEAGIDTADGTSYDFSATAAENDGIVKLNGHIESGDAEKLPYESWDFTNAVDVMRLTNSQYQSIVRQLINNASVLDKIISIDSLLN